MFPKGRVPEHAPKSTGAHISPADSTDNMLDSIFSSVTDEMHVHKESLNLLYLCVILSSQEMDVKSTRLWDPLNCLTLKGARAP
jgi:hypothetical protein